MISNHKKKLITIIIMKLIYKKIRTLENLIIILILIMIIIKLIKIKYLYKVLLIIIIMLKNKQINL